MLGQVKTFFLLDEPTVLYTLPLDRSGITV